MTDALEGQDNTGAVDSDVSFLDSVTSEDLKGNESLTDFKSADDIAQAYVDLKGSLPQVPDSVDAYEFDIPEGVDSGIDEAGMNAFKDLALENKLTSEQYKAVTGFRLAEIAAETKAINEAKNKAIDEMKKDWADNYDANIDKAQKVLQRFEAEDLLTVESPEEGIKFLGNTPALAKFLVKIADSISEDNTGDTGGSNQGDPRQRDDAGQPVFKFKDM